MFQETVIRPGPRSCPLAQRRLDGRALCDLGLNRQGPGSARIGSRRGTSHWRFVATGWLGNP